MKTKKSNQMKHTFAGSKNFFSFLSACANSFVQIISFVPKLPPSEIQEPIVEGSWRSPDPSLLLPNWDAPSLPQHQLSHPWEARDGPGQRAGSLSQVPPWFSQANSSTLAQFYLLICAKCFRTLSNFIF